MVPVETERDFAMADTPSELQARIRRLFLNRELETQSQKDCKRIRPHLNMQEKLTRSVIGTNAKKTNTWE